MPKLIFSPQSVTYFHRCGRWKQRKQKMESEAESRGRFKVTVAPPPETSVGRFRLIPQGSPFLQRGRFSVIPEEETGSPLTQTKLSGPKIVVDHSPEWDFVSISDSHDRLICQAYFVMRIESFLIRLRCDMKRQARKSLWKVISTRRK